MRRYRRMDLLKVLRLRHIRKGPARGVARAFGSSAPSGRISVRSNPAPYWVTAPITDALENGVVGRISISMLSAHRNGPWMGASGHNGDIRRAAHGYEPTREGAMGGFAKSWRRQ